MSAAMTPNVSGTLRIGAISLCKTLALMVLASCRLFGLRATHFAIPDRFHNSPLTCLRPDRCHDTVSCATALYSPGVITNLAQLMLDAAANLLDMKSPSPA